MAEYAEYVPMSRRRIVDECPQRNPERFSVGDLRKEIAMLRRTNNRLGWHPLRAEAIAKLEDHVASRS